MGKNCVKKGLNGPKRVKIVKINLTADALDGNLGVGVVVTIVMAHAYQFGVVRRRGGLLHLGSEEIGEPLRGKSVNVVNRVPFTG